MAATPEQHWEKDQHKLEFFPPDYLRQTVVGTLTAEDARWCIDVCKDITARHGLPYVLVDMKQGGGANSEARKVLGEATPYAACALIGGNPVMRAVAKVVTLAVTTLSSDPVPTGFFKTDEEGLAWLDEQRKKAKASRA